MGERCTSRNQNIKISVTFSFSAASIKAMHGGCMAPCKHGSCQVSCEDYSRNLPTTPGESAEVYTSKNCSLQHLCNSAHFGFLCWILLGYGCLRTLLIFSFCALCEMLSCHSMLPKHCLSRKVVVQYSNWSQGSVC